MKRLLAWVVGCLLVGGLCWAFPLFHIVPLRAAREQQQQGTFDPGAFAKDFWSKKLLPATDRAIAITELLNALAQDPSAARQRFGHSSGVGATTYFFVKGSGHVTGIEQESLRVALEGSPPQPGIELVTGLLFGNTVRDASGLLDVNNFPNSQDFNSLSTELNHIVETQVVPALRERAGVGKAIRFVGCIELEEGPVPKTVQIIPVKIE